MQLLMPKHVNLSLKSCTFRLRIIVVKIIAIRPWCMKFRLAIEAKYKEQQRIDKHTSYQAPCYTVNHAGNGKSILTDILSEMTQYIETIFPTINSAFGN